MSLLAPLTYTRDTQKVHEDVKFAAY